MTVSELPPTTRVPLSHTQKFLKMFDQGDDAGPFSPRYNMVVGWRISGPLDVPTLQGALDDVVARHDVLRSVIVRDGDGPGHQVIHPPCPARLEVRELPARAPAT
jgi:condensation enzyme